jgi:hypothetical protein
MGELLRTNGPVPFSPSGEIEKIRKEMDPHDFKGMSSRYDLYKDSKGNIYIKPKGGRGEGEPTGYNINDF